MRIDILTLFPKMFENVMGESMLKIAQKKKKVKIGTHNLRNWTCDRHKTADDRPYGGGSGMVMKVEPVCKALMSLLGKGSAKIPKPGKLVRENTRIILLTPKGKRFNQKLAKKFSQAKHIIFICGHYEGIDERACALATDELSIGDYIMTGGEIAAMAVLDAIVRLIPGVLGSGSSLESESFEDGLLEYPQYTRPREFEGMKVPDILLSGDHKAISKWRREEAIKKTKRIRSDLLWKK